MLGCCMALFVAAQCSPVDTLWTEEGDGYWISIRYPEIALENPLVGDRLEEYASGLVEIFRNDFDDTFNPEFDTIDWSLEITFDQEPSPDGMICVIAWIGTYMGGAHGNAWSESFVLDLGTGSFPGVVELLGGEEEFQAFTERVIRLLHQEVDSGDWVERGAAARPENYHTVIPVPDESGDIAGFTVLFPPYQVECYARGFVEVFVPVE
jgi:hypothetical protein